MNIEIHACSQGNVSVFGENTGQQCIAMSLCALVDNRRNPMDLVEIMSIGNELHTNLLRLNNQSYLMLT